MTISNVHICSFSSFDELSKRKYGDAEEVWNFLKANGIKRASSFEMTQPLYNSLLELQRQGFIKMLAGGAYPWILWQILK